MQEIYNTSVIRFLFKVNNSKLKQELRLKQQIDLVTKRLTQKHNLKTAVVEYSFGTIEDDFIHDRCRLAISFEITE